MLLVAGNEMWMCMCPALGYLHWLAQGYVPKIQEFHAQWLYQETVPSFDLTGALWTDHGTERTCIPLLSVCLCDDQLSI